MSITPHIDTIPAAAQPEVEALASAIAKRIAAAPSEHRAELERIRGEVSRLRADVDPWVLGVLWADLNDVGRVSTGLVCCGFGRGASPEAGEAAAERIERAEEAYGALYQRRHTYTAGPTAMDRYADAAAQAAADRLDAFDRLGW